MNHEPMKDLDFIHLNKSFKSHFGLKISNEDRTKLLDIIEHDVKFFADSNIMDYSMLIGVEERRTTDENKDLLYVPRLSEIVAT